VDKAREKAVEFMEKPLVSSLMKAEEEREMLKVIEKARLDLG
jgi:hypothetical protein